MRDRPESRRAGRALLLAALLALGVFVPGRGAPERSLTLREAWAMAEANHPRIVEAARRLDSALREVAQREAAYDPTLSASLQGLRYGVDPKGKITEPNPRPSLSASLKLPAGMTFSASVATSAQRVPSETGLDGLQGRIGVTYPLFRTAELDGDALALRQARMSLALAERELEQIRDEARADVLAALHADEIAAVRLALAEEAFVEAEGAWADARRRVALGIASETELLGARIDWLRAEQERLSAQRTRQSRRTQLLELLGLAAEEADYAFESVMDLTAMPEPPPLDEAVARAVARSHSLAERREAADVARLQLEDERRRPRFESRLSASYSTTSEDGQSPGWNVSVDFTYPLLDGGQRQRALDSREEAYERALEAVDDAELAVRRQVEEAYAQLEDALRDEEIARLERTRAELELELVRRQADLPVAVAGEPELRRAEQTLLRAELAWREAVQRYQARWLALQHMVGPVDWERLLVGDPPDQGDRPDKRDGRDRGARFGGGNLEGST